MSDENNKRFCHQCGEEVQENQKFCGNCGTKIEIIENIEQNTNKEEFNNIENNQRQNLEGKEQETPKYYSTPSNFKAYISVIILVFIIFCGFIGYKTYTQTQEEKLIYKEAKELYSNKDYINAKNKANYLLSNKPEYIQLKDDIRVALYIQEGDNLLADKKYNEAISKYESANYIKFESAKTKLEKAKSAKQQAVQNLERSMVRSYDEMTNKSFYYDGAIANNIADANSCYIYIAKNDNIATLTPNFVISYYGHLYLKDHALFNIDGQQYSFDFSADDEVNKAYLLTNWTRFHIDYQQNSSFIKKLIESKRASIRLYSYNDDVYDREISKFEKDAMKRMVDYYELSK